MKRKLLVLMLLLIIFSVFAGIIGKYIKENNTTKNSKTIFYNVNKNTSIKYLAEDLMRKGIIESKYYFEAYSLRMKLSGNINNSKIMIKAGMSIPELINKLKSDQPDFAVVTIPEGFRLYQIAERLEKNNLADKNTFTSLTLEELGGTEDISKRKNIIFDMEGFLFPDTYFIPLTFKEKDIAELMFNRFKQVFTQKHIDRAKELGLSINDVVAIASLIEREAINDPERGTIAGVIYNRLKKGMLLQIDAAVIYANTKGEGHLSKVLYSHLKYDSKYNGYIYKGLPPGPISSPGLRSIEAALYPEQHDYLYYVAGEGGHVFSKTYEEHVVNVKKYIK